MTIVFWHPMHYISLWKIENGFKNIRCTTIPQPCLLLYIGKGGKGLHACSRGGLPKRRCGNTDDQPKSP